MEVRAAFFCDAANISKEGKVNILGVFSAITASKFPTAHGHMAFVALINGHRSEIGNHHIKINFIDEDGRELISPFTGNFIINKESPEVNFILNLSNIKLPRPGLYAADIIIDNHNMKTVTLRAMEKPN